MRNVTKRVWLSLPSSDKYPDDDPWLTLEQTARAYGITPEQLAALADKGPRSHRRDDGSIVYRQGELIEWQRSKEGRAVLLDLRRGGA
ncbi:hypothetical protein [Bifidobacterium sp. SO4]|uniref:hypothetical protein n=1 Tax=Bifidobacterium sp. SO4 TaxID=2809030 RepID=UPI001BDDBC82|nr:hypothetical protein [Bifidobacterium sp. SO4]MBT1169595.1 hypothetical protein [Bifidobacterium sp. SO4]